MTIRWKWERDLRDNIWWTECLMNYGWRYLKLYRKQGSRPSPRKEMQKNKMAVWGGLTNSCEKKRSQSKGEEERYTHLNAEFQRLARRDKKALLSDQCKEIEENNRMGKTRDLFRRRQWQPTPVLLPGKSHGWGSLVGCSPWGLEESDTTERLHFHFSLSCIGDGNGNPLQCSCLQNPRDGGAWRAAVYGVAQSRTQLKRLSSSSSRELQKPTVSPLAA